MQRQYQWFLPALALLVLAGCGGGGFDYLGTQRALWSRTKPASYRYTINYGSWVDSCVELKVTVPATGEPQVTMTEDCKRVFNQAVRNATTMEKVFELEAALLKRGKNTRVTFDPTYGFPTRVYFTGEYNDFESFNVLNFEVLPTP